MQDGGQNSQFQELLHHNLSENDIRNDEMKRKLNRIDMPIDPLFRNTSLLQQWKSFTEYIWNHKYHFWLCVILIITTTIALLLVGQAQKGHRAEHKEENNEHTQHIQHSAQHQHTQPEVTMPTSVIQSHHSLNQDTIVLLSEGLKFLLSFGAAYRTTGFSKNVIYKSVLDGNIWKYLIPTFFYSVHNFFIFLCFGKYDFQEFLNFLAMETSNNSTHPQNCIYKHFHSTSMDFIDPCYNRFHCKSQ